jgi:hypothetical protein
LMARPAKPSTLTCGASSSGGSGSHQARAPRPGSRRACWRGMQHGADSYGALASFIDTLLRRGHGATP